MKNKKVVKKEKKPADIRIVVAGGTAKGKSTVLQVIAEALNSKGLSFEVRSVPFEDISPIVIAEYQNQRVEKVKGKKPHIVLEERTTYRIIAPDGDRLRIAGVRE